MIKWYIYYKKIVYNVCTLYCEMRDGAAMYGFAGMFLHKNGCTAKWPV